MVAVIDETESDLRALIERDVGPISASTDFLRALLDWLHFRARSIPQQPRAVIISPEVEQQMGKYPAIAKIRNEISQGKDLGPWLSDSVRTKASDPLADMMFNDWQIIHFHLGTIFVGPNKVRRTRDVLFAFVAPDHAVLLDVKPHGRGTRAPWAMQDLLRVLLRVNPSDMTRTQFKGALGLAGGPRTDYEILKLRQSGVNSPIEIDGRVFLAPGLGVSSSKHSTRLVRAIQNVMRQIAHTREMLHGNSIPSHLLRRISSDIGVPVRLGIKMNAEQFVVYDKNRKLDLLKIPVLS
jgi:hypothetical protein